MSEEQFLIKFIGGPHQGTISVGSSQYPWPLPGIIQDAGPGFYQKISETDVPGISRQRGATYEWRKPERK